MLCQAICLVVLPNLSTTISIDIKQKCVDGTEETWSWNLQSLSIGDGLFAIAFSKIFPASPNHESIINENQYQLVSINTN